MPGSCRLSKIVAPGVRLGENAVANELAGFISSEVDRTNSLVTRFLEFAKPLALRLHKADLTEVLDLAVTHFQRSPAAARVSVYKNYSPDIPPFPLDVELMERVIFNLVVNAAEASPPDGAVTLKTRPVDGTAAYSAAPSKKNVAYTALRPT